MLFDILLLKERVLKLMLKNSLFAIPSYNDYNFLSKKKLSKSVKKFYLEHAHCE